MQNLPTLSFADTKPDELAIDHQIEVSTFTGAAVVRVPLALTQGRSDFGPQFVLEYNSSAGNSPYGLGWSLSGLPIITLNTKKCLPKYDGQDEFVFSGSGELTATLRNQDGQWKPWIEKRGDFWVRYYRGKSEASHFLVEQWTHKATGRIHWRTRDTENVVTVYGFDTNDNSRITDPEDTGRTLTWFPEIQIDPHGNAIQYEYAVENHDNVDPALSYERSRPANQKLPQRYLKRVRYGNTKPLEVDGAIPADNKWSFEVVFDYGDHQQADLPTPNPTQKWELRPDPFSTCRSGFEVRTYRLCRRILLFHRFDELSPEAVLVGMHRLEHDLRPEGSTLKAVQYTGFRRDFVTGQISQRSLPPLRFTYSVPSVARTFQAAPPESLQNVPHGISGSSYRWIDLYGEGLPGILTETAQAWYFKSNEGEGHFSPQKLVLNRPAYRLGQVALSDFDNDGNANLVVLHGRQGGFYEYNRDTESWDSFRPFASLPHHEAAGTKSQWLDLNGDGRVELILSDPERITWYPSLGKDGFDTAVEIQRPHVAASPSAPLTDDPSLDFFFADMNGDGLLDQVLVRNGRVEYWPHLGNGCFGDPILMEDSPLFAPEIEFNASRILLVDLDGNGTADIVYVGSGEVRYWINAGGNRLIEGGRLCNLPYIDNLSTLRVLDFLGDGTPCLVWSSPLTDRPNPVQYLPLTNSVKPRLLLSVENSMGQEVKLTYSTSAKHYLRDKHAGRPWHTKLPTHPVVVDKKEVIDHIGNSLTLTRYEYHDGYFDGEEQSFQGFGLVDQYDTELHSDGMDEVPEIAFTTPACLRTWFHTGRAILSSLVESYHGDPEQVALRAHTFENPAEVGSGEFEDALRTLSGVMIRQESFAVLKEKRADHPFRATQNSYCLKRLQPSQNGLDASFTFYLCESLTYDYEQKPDDPRVTHDFTFEVDSFGNVLQDCSVSYARRPGIQAETAAQRQLSISVGTYRYANFESLDRHELGIPIEEKEFEATGLLPDASGVFVWTQLWQQLNQALAVPLAFHAAFTNGVQARLIRWERNFYWNDAANAPLPLGEVGNPTLSHHDESACFTPEYISKIYDNKVDANILQNEGGYRLKDNYWWQIGETYHYSRDNFPQLERIERLDGSVTTFTYDPASLTIIEIQDALGNRTRGEIDYHLIAPLRITDPNDNIAEVIYDPLGIITVSTVYGKVLDSSNHEQAYGQAPLAQYTVRNDAIFDTILANPERYLQKTAQFTCYDLDTWMNAAKPPRVIKLVREEFLHDGTGGGVNDSRIQVAISYFDGFRRVLQSKTLVEPGPAFKRDNDGNLVLDNEGNPVEVDWPDDRWLVSGHTIYNQKQQPIRQYEPFFSTTAIYEAEKILTQYGVFHQFRYDAMGRLVEEDLPNYTFTKTEFSAWEIRRYDPNDAVLDSLYRTLREGLPDDDVEKKALRKAEDHANTPTILHLNPQGMEVKQVNMTPDGHHRITETTVNINGKVTALTDPRGLTAFQYHYDMLDRVLFTDSIDAGKTWTLLDIYDRPIHLWDSRGVHQRRQFDQLDRPTSVFVDGALELHHLSEVMIYGEDATINDSKLHNLRGRLALHQDQAGIVTFQQYDFAEQVIRYERRICRNYASEPNWDNPAAVALEPERYVTQNSFDALGRIRHQSLPDGTTRHFDYLRGGGLHHITLSSNDGKLNNVVLFNGSSFNARGQRTRTLLGNGVEISHQFDYETFRTKRITARRLPRGGVGNQVTLQDLAYTYDPVGNITHCVEEAQQPTNPMPILQGLNVSSESEFTYDALYQLTQATGRVHQALEEHDYRPNAPGTIKGTRHLSFNNGAAVERYTRNYHYDLAGNLKRVQHRGFTQNWTTEMWVSSTSNRSLPAKDANGNPIADPELRFDANGNCVFLTHLRQLDWNYRNNIAKAVLIDRSGEGKPDDAEYYVYDGTGLRVRKVMERLVNGKVEITEKIYLDDCEIKRIRYKDEQPFLERLTSNISDGINRIALVHRWATDTLARETDNTAQPHVRYQLTNHLGSSQLELDEQGAVISYEEYFPFGGTAFIAGDDQREVEVKDYRFCGKERDDATGLYYFGYRYYASWIGRWIGPDPIGPEDSLNLYLYALNNPINLVDPTGLRSDESNRGKVVPLNHEESEETSDIIQKAWANLPEDRREMLRKEDYVLHIDKESKKVTFMTYPEATDFINQKLNSNEDVGIDVNLLNPEIRPQEYSRSFEFEDFEIKKDTGTGPSQQRCGAENGGDGKQEQGGANGPNGGPADSNDKSSSGDSGATGTHDGDGSSSQNTPPTGGTGNEGVGQGAGKTGHGRGYGGTGQKPGLGKDSGLGYGEGSTGTGVAKTSGTGDGSDYTQPGGKGQLEGNGAYWGIPGGKGTAPPPPFGQYSYPPGQTANGDFTNNNRPDGSRGTPPSSVLDYITRAADWWLRMGMKSEGESSGKPSTLQKWITVGLGLLDLITTFWSFGGTLLTKGSLKLTFKVIMASMRKAFIGVFSKNFWKSIWKKSILHPDFWRKFFGGKGTPVSEQLGRFFWSDVGYKQLKDRFIERYPTFWRWGNRLSEFLGLGPLQFEHGPFFVKFLRDHPGWRPIVHAGWNLIPLPRKLNILSRDFPRISICLHVSLRLGVVYGIYTFVIKPAFKTLEAMYDILSAKIREM